MEIDSSYYHVSNFIYEEDFKLVEKFLSIYKIGFFTKIPNFHFMISAPGKNIYFTKNCSEVLKCISKFKKIENFT